MKQTEQEKLSEKIKELESQLEIAKLKKRVSDLENEIAQLKNANITIPYTQPGNGMYPGVSPSWPDNPYPNPWYPVTSPLTITGGAQLLQDTTITYIVTNNCGDLPTIGSCTVPNTPCIFSIN